MAATDDFPASLEWIGRTLLAIQADMRAMRDENALTRDELDRVISMVRHEAEALQLLHDVLRSTNERLGRLEAIERRLDRDAT